MKIIVRLAVLTVALSILSAANPVFADKSDTPDVVNPMLKALDKNRPILSLVRKHYPKATSSMSKNTMHVESFTQLYTMKAVTKLPKGQAAPLAKVRGPKESGGVWCEISLLRGSSKIYARAAGALDRGHFTEHVVYQDLAGTNNHLYVILRVPKGEGSAQFVKEFKSLISLSTSS